MNRLEHRLGLNLSRNAWDHPSSTPEDPRAVEFWEQLDVTNLDNPLFKVLCHSIYEYVRNCCAMSVQFTKYNAAKSYVNPEMFRFLEDFFHAPYKSCDDKEFEYMDDNTADLLAFAFYLSHNLEVEERTRPGCPELKMPYIARSELQKWIHMQIKMEPARVHHYINLLMEFSEGHIVDPSTENPWPFRLPRSSFPAQPDKQFVDVSVPAMRATWEELRPEILEKRRSQAIDNGEPTRKEWIEMQKSQGAQMRMMNQAAANSINMSNMTANNIQQMAYARNGERLAAWGALQSRSNIDHMGSGMF